MNSWKVSLSKKQTFLKEKFVSEKLLEKESFSLSRLFTNRYFVRKKSRNLSKYINFVNWSYLVEKLDIVSIVVVGEVEHASRGVRPYPLQAAISVRHPSRLRALLQLVLLRHRGCSTNWRKNRSLSVRKERGGGEGVSLSRNLLRTGVSFNLYRRARRRLPIRCSNFRPVRSNNFVTCLVATVASSITSQCTFLTSIKVCAILVSSGICSGLRYVGVTMYRGSAEGSSGCDGVD